MKKLKTALFASTLLTAMFMYNSLEAFDGDNRWDVRICIERYPDGTGGIGSGCVYPEHWDLVLEPLLHECSYSGVIDFEFSGTLFSLRGSLNFLVTGINFRLVLVLFLKLAIPFRYI